MSIAWLRDLEERVHEAARRLRELGEENEKLRQRVADLETQLTETEAADEQRAVWAEEREEIRDRVGKLVSHLEEMLEEPAEAALSE